jgi:hypothetical protein
MCTYMGGDVDVYKEACDEDKLSFLRLRVLLKNMDTNQGTDCIT